ncbi:MAG: nucleotidyltransferase domain-containing protein [Deltaproteobacteria bacterium]|nr:nucleotidyltransferase domain-containing protein [Deltaproteobacteria bacterium]
MLKEKFKELEARLLSEIKSFYGGRLISVVIFGSVARETQNFDSDLDVLVIAEGLPKGRMKRISEFETVEEKIEPFLESLRKEEGINTYISAIIKSTEEVERGSPLFLDMVEDANILFDRNGFFKEKLDKLRKRLKELGSRRVWKGNAWYWDLKPDYKPGEIFEI